MKIKSGMVFILFIASFINENPASAAVPKQVFEQGSRYNVNMRIALKGTMPFSVNTVAKAGKKASVTEIADDGSETLVEMIPRKSFQNQKAGLMIDVKVTKTVRGTVRSTEKAQIFAFENQESEVRFGAGRKGREDLSLAVLANPI